MLWIPWSYSRLALWMAQAELDLSGLRSVLLKAALQWLQSSSWTKLLSDTLQRTYERHLVCDIEFGLFRGSKTEEDFPEASQSGSMGATGQESTRVRLQTHLRKGKHTRTQVCCQGPLVMSSPVSTVHGQGLISTDLLVSHFSSQLFMFFCWETSNRYLLLTGLVQSSYFRSWALLQPILLVRQ